MTTALTIRRAAPDDAPAITEHRRLMFEAMGFGSPEERAVMAPAFEDWVRLRLASGEYLGWLAVDEAGFPAAGAGLWVRAGRRSRSM